MCHSCFQIRIFLPLFDFALVGVGIVVVVADVFRNILGVLKRGVGLSL